MSNLKGALLGAALIAGLGIFPGSVKAQLTGHYGKFHYAIPGAWYSPNLPRIRPQGQQYSSVDSLYEKASDEKRKGNYAAAFQIYTKIINLDPQQAQAYFNRGFVNQSKLNNRAGAMADFEIALRLFQGKGDRYMTRASIEHIQELKGR